MSQKRVDEVKLPGEQYSSRIRARFWITGEQQGYVGIGRIELLENVERYGSINRAAKEMGMSYKKAWKLIEEMNQMSERPLVVKSQGGRSGGGTSVTQEGEKLIAHFRELEKDLALFLERVSEKLNDV